MSDATFSHLSNEELRQELNKNGIAYGPIMANTRKVYEKKLQNMLEGKLNLDGSLVNGIEQNGNNGVAMNGNARTPSRETTPVVELPNQNGEERMHEASPQLTTNKEEDSDDEEDATEIIRVLTPEEARIFQSGLVQRYSQSPSKIQSPNANIRQRREMSVQSKSIDNGISNSTRSSATGAKFKRYGMPILVLFVVASMIASALYFREHLAFPILKELPNMFKRQPEEKLPHPLED